MTNHYTRSTLAALAALLASGCATGSIDSKTGNLPQGFHVGTIKMKDGTVGIYVPGGNFDIRFEYHDSKKNYQDKR